MLFFFRTRELPLSDLKTPDYWRARAKDARAEADQMGDAKTKKALLRIAQTYDELADGFSEMCPKQPFALPPIGPSRR